MVQHSLDGCLPLWMEKNEKSREREGKVKKRKVWDKGRKEGQGWSLETWWVVVPKLVLGELGQGTLLAEILEIPLFLFLVKHCKLSEQIMCSFIEFETFNQGGLFWAIPL